MSVRRTDADADAYVCELVGAGTRLPDFGTLCVSEVSRRVIPSRVSLHHIRPLWERYDAIVCQPPLFSACAFIYAWPGGSDAPEARFDEGLFTAQLDNLISKLDLPTPVNLVGYSMGGMVFISLLSSCACSLNWISPGFC